MANLTLSIDRTLLKEARKIALERDTTVNSLVRSFLEELVRREGRKRAEVVSELMAHYAATEVDLSAISWTRDEIHER